jgi:hypothetical protein
LSELSASDVKRRPGYTTAEDKREFLLVSLAGWRFERRSKPAGWRREMHWYITGPCKSYLTGPYGTRREAIQQILEYYVAGAKLYEAPDAN